MNIDVPPKIWTTLVGWIERSTEWIAKAIVFSAIQILPVEHEVDLLIESKNSLRVAKTQRSTERIAKAIVFSAHQIRLTQLTRT